MNQNKLSPLKIYSRIFIVVFIIIILNFLFFGDRGSQPNDDLLHIALQLNLKAPTIIDNTLRFDSARVLPGNKFRYNYTILGMEKSMIDTTIIITEGKKIFTNNIKTGYGFAYFKTYGTEILNCFYDSTGKYICGFQITPNEYR